MGEWSAHTNSTRNTTAQRWSDLRSAARRRFDLIVVGGGINGAGIARDAALRGLSVLLLERDDYGFGTTWRSTKLIHGGLRYLEHREFRLCIRGAARTRHPAPHGSTPGAPAGVPGSCVPRGRYGPRTIRAGLLLYDLLSAGKRLPTIVPSLVTVRWPWNQRSMGRGSAAALPTSTPRCPSPNGCAWRTYWTRCGTARLPSITLRSTACWYRRPDAGRTRARYRDRRRA